MHNRKTAARGCLCLLVLLVLSGCGFKDIDKRFFVIAVGIDKGKTRSYEVSLRLAIPSPRVEPGESKFEFVSQEADSIAEAVRLMKSKVDKEFDFGHCKIIILGKSFANAETGRSLDWFYRRRDIQQISYMAIGEPDAKSVIKLKPKSERLPGNALILAFSSEGTESPYILPELLFDYYRRYRNSGKDPYLPIVNTYDDKFDITRVAIFHEDRKRLELSPEETSLLKQLIRNYARIIVKAEVNGKSITFAGQQIKTKYRIVTPPGGRPEIQMNVHVKGETEESPFPLFDQSWGKYETMLAEQVRQRYTDLLEKLQKNNVDPVGFGLRYRAIKHKGSADWENWQKIYPQVKFVVKASVKLRGTGVIK